MARADKKRTPRKGQVPPQLDLDDRGFRWWTEGQRLHIRRKVNFLAVFWPAIMALGTFGVGVALLLDRDWWLGGFMVFATIFPAAFLWARTVDRSEMTLGPDGLHWEQTKPRAFVGHWPAKDLDGVRMVLGEEPASWGHRRLITVDVRRKGGWVVMASGHSRKRAERFAAAISETRAWPIGVHDEGKEGRADH